MAEFLEPIVQQFRGDASGLIKEVAKAEAAEESFARTSKKTSDRVGKDQKDSEKAFTDFDRLLRSKLKDDETALGGFQRELTNAKTKVADLRTELQRSSGSDSLGIFQNLKQAKADLKDLENIGKDLLPDFSKAGQQSSQGFFKSFSSDLTEGFGSLGGSLTPILVGVAAGAAPPIIAVLGAAITTALGAGAIAVGIAGVAHDSRVQAAFEQLKTTATNIFHSVTAPLIQPVIDGLKQVQIIFNQAAPGLRGLFTTLGEVTKPLIVGFGGFIDRMLPGLESGLQAAEPLLADFAKLLPWLGQKIGEMFDEFGHGGPGARLALEGLIGEIGNIAVVIGKVYQGASAFFLWLDKSIANTASVMAGMARTMANVPGWLGGDPAAFNALADRLASFRDGLRANIAAASEGAGATQHYVQGWNLLSVTGQTVINTLNGVIEVENKWISASQGADDANLSMHQSLLAFNTELTKGKHAWDLNYAAGQKNVGLLNAANQGITHYYDNLKTLHPLSRGQIQDELDAELALYNHAKALGATDGELATIKGTISGLRTQLALLNGTTATFTVHAKTIGPVGLGVSKATFRAEALGGVVHADQGLVSGVLAPSDPGTLMVLAGERRTKGEVFMPLAGISQDRAMNLAQVAGNAHGFDVVPRAAYRPVAYAGSGGVQTVVIPISIGGKHMATVHQALIGPSQRYKARTGTTGLS